jgi:peptidoglycan/LPS O-acetylase OafA/YrhL
VTNERLDVLDGLRGFAILLVVWYHARLVSGQSFGPFDPIVQAGYLGVDLFFFVSGFCLFYPYAKCARDGKPQPSTRRFFQRRLLKIVPSYLLALFTFAALYHAQFGTVTNLAMHVAAHLAFVHTLVPATFGSISGPLWTIGVEVQFYLIFPLIVPWFRRSPLLGYAALFVLAETYRLTIGAFAPAPSFWWINQLPAFVDVFGAGMLAAYVIGGIHHQRTWDPRAATVCSGGAFTLALAGLIAAAAACAPLPDDPARWWLNGHRFMFGPLCIALAVPAYFALERWRRFVAPPALVMLSAISYNLYLWHLEIMVWVHNTGLPAAATIAIALPLALAVAATITYRFERPILDGHYRLSIPTAALSAGLRLWKCTVPTVRYVASPDDPHVRRGVKPRTSPAT